MSNNRDEFLAPVRRVLAERAGQRCSFCKTPTIGPSDESPTAVMRIGVAAHITAAARGRGARRYDAALTAEERSSAENGIWLCQSCSVIIDRDEVRFSPEILHVMKREHTEFARLGQATLADVNIISIGPHLTAAGQILSIGSNGLEVGLAFFLEGSSQELLSFVHKYEDLPALERHVIVSEMGSGGLLAEKPTVERDGNSFLVRFQWQAPAPLRDASLPINGMSRETGRRLSGMDYLIQCFEYALSRARGTWFADIDGGSDISELYWRFRESSWFAQLMKTELIRLASVPSPRSRSGDNNGHPPLICVSRVNDVRVPCFDLDDRQRLNIEVDFVLEGAGNWTGTIPIHIYSPDQLEQERAKAIWVNENIRRAEGGESMLPTEVPPEGWRPTDGFSDF